MATQSIAEGRRKPLTNWEGISEDIAFEPFLKGDLDLHHNI